MTVLKRAAIAVVLAGTALSGFVFAPMLEAQVARPAPAPRATATDTLAQSYVAQNRAPGIVLAVGTRGQPAHFAHAGRIDDAANGEAADADSLWRVYSMTKPITGMAAMMLVEDGKLRLDQPIHELIPAFKDMKVLTDPENSLVSRPAARPITVRHLLTHTAGLGYSIVTTGPLKAEYERLGILPGAVEPKTEAQAATVRPKSLEEFANRLATLPLIADPGTEWSYSIGLDLLPRVIEVASGMSFEQFLQSRMFGPLGMTSTYWAVPAGEVGRLGPNYFWAGDNRIPLDPAGSASVYARAPSFPYGGAGLVMSARDYDRFLAMLLNGGELGGKRVMKAETVRTAMSNLLPQGVTFGGIPGTGAQNAAGGYGAGGFVTLADVPGGPGAGTYGWGGAAGTIAWVDPKNGLRASAYVNYFPAEKWPLRTDLMKAVYSR
ncbi:serine hydrolase domain-containing protein [Sphingomonas sp. AX6]|uniref:serine hydrolase domain-containing protein n=1 Tax=Sphingomonas sp. AX6 TaxID=2653171 RepID=UPI0012F3DCAE|nr:serine hydrolase domain-containing protein [Sphingomonas sp. AX6]VXC71169.1 Beta-lactamase class C and other penicillin binding proteins [Sphingomonas sp. AX6]